MSLIFATQTRFIKNRNMESLDVLETSRRIDNPQRLPLDIPYTAQNIAPIRLAIHAGSSVRKLL